MIKLVEASGGGRKVGEELGEQCRDLGEALVERFRSIWSDKGWTIDHALWSSKKYLAYAGGNFFPRYMQEIIGYAKAINANPDEVLAWFCPTQKRGCTDIVLSHRVAGYTYLLHNEDYDVPEEGLAVMVKIKPDDGPAFLAMSYGGIWLNAGVNEAGIGIGGNALTPNDARVGIPNDFVFLKIYSAKTLSQAMAYSTPPMRASSYCNVICDDRGEMYAMEASATDFAALHGRDYLVHTNHYVHPSMVKYDKDFQTGTDRSPVIPHANSIIRYNRAVNLVEDLLEPIRRQRALGHSHPGLAPGDLAELLVDHQNNPWSICRHVDKSFPENEQTKTCYSEIINVTERTISVCKGNPCENRRKIFQL